VNFAKFYEEGGTIGQAEPDLDSARKILEKGTKVNFKAVEDLAEVWCEWSEMEIRQECGPVLPLSRKTGLIYRNNRNYDEAIRVMQRAAAIPKNTKINYHDHVGHLVIAVLYASLTINDPVPLSPGSTIQVSQTLVVLRGP
jgi:pre-mRNA-splicing factor SYF1